MATPDADPPTLGEHLLPTRTRRLGDVPGPEQRAIEARQKLLRPADVERIGHRHHTADPRAQHRRGDRRERIVGLLVDHARLARVQHHRGDPAVAQQAGELPSILEVRLAVDRLEGQLADRTFQLVRVEVIRLDGTDRFGSVSPMAIEVDDVIVVRSLVLKVFAQSVERRWSEQRHLRGQILVDDHFDQRSGERPEPDVLLERPTGDEEDVDPVLRQRTR